MDSDINQRKRATQLRVETFERANVTPPWPTSRRIGGNVNRLDTVTLELVYPVELVER